MYVYNIIHTSIDWLIIRSTTDTEPEAMEVEVQGDDTSLWEATSAGMPPGFIGVYSPESGKLWLAQNKWKMASRVWKMIPKKMKKDLVPLLYIKEETYDPPALDVCSKMCLSLPEFKEFAKYISTFSHLNSPIPITNEWIKI